MGIPELQPTPPIDKHRSHYCFLLQRLHYPQFYRHLIRCASDRTPLDQLLYLHCAATKLLPIPKRGSARVSRFHTLLFLDEWSFDILWAITRTITAYQVQASVLVCELHVLRIYISTACVMVSTQSTHGKTRPPFPPIKSIDPSMYIVRPEFLVSADQTIERIIHSRTPS